MSREIKFRVWDNEKERMQFVGAIDWDYKFELLTCNTDTDKLYMCEKDDFVLQQFTGLKDKNNRDVYEGDIVHCRMLKSDWQGILDDYIAVVEDDICNPCFVLKQANGRLEYDFVKCDLMELDIIGNIYEDKELLVMD